MAGCSKKQYAIMMQAGADGKKLASEMGGMEQEAFNKAFSELLGSSGGYNQDDDEDYRDFDPDSDDDYGFDEEDDFESDFNEMKDSGIDVENPQEVMEYLGANMGLDREDQVKFMERMGYTVDDIERLRNPDDDEDDEYNKEMTAAQNENADMRENEPEDNHLSYEKVFTNNDNAQIEKYAKHYGVDASELKDEIHQKALDNIREGSSVTNAKNDAMEEVLDSLDDSAKGNPYDPEKLPDEGMSQEELDKLNLGKKVKDQEGELYKEDLDKMRELGMNGYDVEKYGNLENAEDQDDGWKVTRGSAVPGGRGGHTDYNDGQGNWITDWGNGKVYAYLDGKSLGKKFGSVEEAKAALNKKKLNNKTSAPEKPIKEKVDEMKDEFYGIDKKEMDNINKDLAERNSKQAKIDMSANQINEAMDKGDSKKALEIIRGLLDEEFSEVYRKLNKRNEK